jgi:Carboxypeptidase regulatory-like domain
LKYLRILSLLLLILCATNLLKAQSTDATISGVVVDPSGKVITDAVIEILNEATGVHYSSRTNGTGIYSVTVLPPGQYIVQVSKIGFKTLIKPDIVLNLQSALALNFTLPIGAASESVTVDAGASSINTTDGSVSTVIE